MKHGDEPDAARVPSPPSRDSYHHGNLRQALVDAALELIANKGAAGLSVREAAKSLGVSPGAPLRHFENKGALVIAVAEQATQRLRQRMEASLEAASGTSASVRFRTMGEAYLDWALENPAQFRVVSERGQGEFNSSGAMLRDNDAIRQHMASLLKEIAGEDGESSPQDIAHIQIAARALVYGLARMSVDGHFPEWGLSDEPQRRTLFAVLELFVRLLRNPDAPFDESRRTKPER